MTFLFSRRRLIGAIVLATSLGSGAALSQNGPRAADPLPQSEVELARPPVIDNGVPGKPEILVPCCRCVDGSKQQISINTGSAPWMVTSAIPGLPGPWPIQAGAISNPHPFWAPMTAALAPAKWIQPSTSTVMGDFKNGTSVFTLKIKVPNCTVPMKVVINGQLGGDDSALAYIDNAAATINAPPTPAGFGLPPRNIAADISTPGVHTLRVVVQNIGGGPTGMILRGAITKICSDRLEKDPRTDRKD